MHSLITNFAPKFFDDPTKYREPVLSILFLHAWGFYLWAELGVSVHMH
jgi:hypothetical protein